MKTFILIQMQIDNEVIDGINKNISMSNVVRRIEAENKEITIGKFVIATRDIKAKNKLNIECYELSNLLRVD